MDRHSCRVGASGGDESIRELGGTARNALYALDDVLDIEPDAPTEAVYEELDERRTATGTLIGLFAR